MYGYGYRMADFNTRLSEFMDSYEVRQWGVNFYMTGSVEYGDFKQLMLDHQSHARKFGLVWSNELWSKVCNSKYMDFIKERREQLESED